MTERELRDWLRYAELRPLSDQLADIHNAMLCAIVANLARDPSSAPTPVEAFYVLRAPTAPDVPSISEAERVRAALAGG